MASRATMDGSFGLSQMRLTKRIAKLTPMVRLGNRTYCLGY